MNKSMLKHMPIILKAHNPLRLKWRAQKSNTPHPLEKMRAKSLSDTDTNVDSIIQTPPQITGKI